MLGFFYRRNPMQVDDEHLINIFRKIRNVKECKNAYLLAGDDPRLSVDDLIEVVSHLYGIKIETWNVVFEQEHVPGMLIRFEGDDAVTQILVASRLDDNWKRFVATKELSQIIIDAKEDWCPDANLVIEDLLTAFELDSKANGEHEPEKRTANELIAEMVAIELMYPYSDRVANELNLSIKNTSWSKLEIRYQMPAVMIRRAHSRWYKEICDTIWPLIQTENNA